MVYSKMEISDSEVGDDFADGSMNMAYASAPEPEMDDFASIPQEAAYEEMAPILAEARIGKAQAEKGGSAPETDLRILAELLLLLLTGNRLWNSSALAKSHPAFLAVLTRVLEQGDEDLEEWREELVAAAELAGMNLKVKPALNTARELAETAPIAPALAISVIAQLARRVQDGELFGEDQILDALIQK
jgi:hypothetical protein